MILDAANAVAVVAVVAVYVFTQHENAASEIAEICIVNKPLFRNSLIIIVCIRIIIAMLANGKYDSLIDTDAADADNDCV